MPREAEAVEVRALGEADLPFAFALSRRVFSRYSGDPDGTLHRIFAARGAQATVIERGGARLGFAAFRVTPLGRPFGPWANPARGYLDAIAVVPEAHGRGAGGVLLRHAQHAAQAVGAVTMSLMTAETNERALRLFTSAGFHRLYVELNAYRGGQRGIILTRGLGDVA